MEISKALLGKFVDLIMLKGTVEIQEAIFNINKDLSTFATTGSRHIALRGILPDVKEDWGKIGLGDLKLIKKFLNSFSEDELIITKNKNKLVFQTTNGKHKISHTITSPQYITNVEGEDKMDSLVTNGKGNEFFVSSGIISEIVNYFTTVNSPTIVLSSDGSNLIMKASKDSNEVEAKFDLELETPIKEFSVTVNKILIDVLSVIKDNCTFSIKNNAPIYIKVENERLNFEYLVCPETE